MSIADALQRLDQVIELNHTDQLLCTFLQVTLAIERAIQADAQLIESTLSPAEQQTYASTIVLLRESDMLSFISAPGQETVESVRTQIKSGQSALIADWYRTQWKQPAWPSELIVASLANSLRPIMMIVLGNVELLRRQVDVPAARLDATQAVLDAIELLREARRRIGLHLAEKGVEIASF